MGDDGSVVTRGSCDTATVSGLFFKVGDNGTFGHAPNGHDVTNGQLSFLASINKLATVHAFGGDEKFLFDLVTIGIPIREAV